MRPPPESAEALLILLKENPRPRELEITALPIDETEKKTNTFIKVDVHLGINARDVPRLAKDYREDYYALRQQFACIQQDVMVKEEINAFCERFMSSISCLLMLCADHASSWSDRRRIILFSKIGSVPNDDLTDRPESIWKEEIEFLDFLFTRHSKATNAWSYRKWICQEMVANIQNCHANNTKDMWEGLISWARHEIDECIRVAERYPKNYYAWTHRYFVIRNLLDHQKTKSLRLNNPQLEGNDSKELLSNLLREEIDSIHPWLRRHISDHSAVHYGGEVLRIWLSDGCAVLNSSKDHFTNWRIKTMQDVLVKSRNLSQLFQSHEVIWIWRRICCQIFLGILAEEALNCTESDEKALLTRAINQFVNTDVNQTLADLSLERLSAFDDEGHRYRVYSKTYVMWILKHFRRCNSYDLMSIDVHVDELEAKLTQSLASNDCIRHNMWRNRIQ